MEKNKRKAIVLEFSNPIWRHYKDYADFEFMYFNILTVGKRDKFQCLKIENQKRTIDEYRAIIGKKLRIIPENVFFTGDYSTPLDPLVFLYITDALVEDNLFKKYFNKNTSYWKHIKESYNYV